MLNSLRINILRKIKLRSVLLSLFLAVALYFVVGAAFFCFLQYRGEPPAVTLSEILLLPLPGRWAQYENKQGQALIQGSQALFRSGNFKAGYHALKVGLAKAPADREGLLLFAQLHVDLHRIDLAEKALIKGLKYHRHDPTYLKAVLTFLFAHQKDQEAFKLCSEWLKQPTGSSALTQFIALGAATACYYRGCYEQAMSLLRQHHLLGQKDGLLLNAKIQWELGNHELSLQQLRTLAHASPGDEAIYRQLLSYLRENSRHSEARQLSLNFQLARPDLAQPRIDLLRDTLSQPNSTARQKEVDETVRYLSQDPQALLALAEMAATRGQPALVRQIQLHLKQPSPESDAAALLTIEALVVAKDYEGALAAAAEFSKRTTAPAANLLNVTCGLQAIAHFGRRDAEAGQLSLNSFLANRNLRAANLLAIAHRLFEVGAHQPAREVLARAVAIDPLNQAARTRLLELDLEDRNTEAIPTHIRHLLTTRKPSREILRRAQRQLGSDRLLFSRDNTSALNALTAHLSAAHPATLRLSAN